MADPIIDQNPQTESNPLHRLDLAVRRFDRWFNSTNDNRLASWLPIMQGHSLSGIASFLALIPFLILGPSFSSFRVSQPSAYLTTLLALVCFFFIAWLSNRRLSLFCIQATMVTACFAFLFVVPVLGTTDSLAKFDAYTSEISGGLYPHLLLPFAMMMTIMALVAHVCAKLATAGLRREFPETQRPEELLSRTELFETPNRNPKISNKQMLLALVLVPLKFPVELLLLPSIYVVVAANGSQRDFWVSIALLGLAWLLIAFGEIHYRLRLARRLLQRLFSYGGLWLVSVTIIGLAAAWLTQMSYVRTVMEGASWLVVQYLIAALCLFWWMEYWVNRSLSQRLLALFHPQEIPSEEISFELHPQAPTTTRVERTERRLRLHGAGRFIVLGKRQEDQLECWQFIDRTDLFSELARAATPEARDRIQRTVRNIHERIKTYFVLINFGLILATGACVWFVETRPVQAVVVAEAGTGVIDPRELLFQSENATSSATKSTSEAKQSVAAPPRVILFAASGGGTRAAVYTTSLLHGLQRIGVLKEARLVSGVSGGGLSLTWFASRYKKLLTEDSTSREQAWREYFAAMEHPYIVDVLHGGAEARIAQGVPLSQLLAESFGKRLYSEDDDIAWRFKQIDKQLGLILNTTLCGQFPAPHGQLSNAGSIERFDTRKSSAYYAGGRLIFTNLKCTDAFSEQYQSPQKVPTNSSDKTLPYVVIEDSSIRLPIAAALNANFPPVFPNAPVDVQEANGNMRRYWVTDGGAEENRGVLTLLHILRKTISQRETLLAQQSKSNDQKSKSAAVWPEIHIVVAEASAESVEFGCDRGVGAVTGAKDLLPIAWAHTLLEKINQEYADVQRKHGQNNPVSIKLHVLPMPSCLRFGGIGTHWMLPRTVRLSAVDVSAVPAEPVIELSDVSVMKLIRDLHLPDGVSSAESYSESKDAIETVRNWIRNDPLSNHPKKWEELQRVFRGEPEAPKAK